MPSGLETALQKALSVRLNLQISLSQLPIIEEWMDIHLDRWLEHNPTPPDMPDGEGVSYLAMLGSDLRRVWWGAWGDPRGFVPRMSDYFKLCNIAKSDAHLLDQIGEALEPKLVGSWIGVWGGKVTTGYHFLDPQPWTKIEAMFGTHEAKYKVKKFVEEHGIERIERFTQSIGDSPYSEIELKIPGATIEDQVRVLSETFEQFTGAPIAEPITARMREAGIADFALSLRIRGGQIVRVGALAPGIALDAIQHLCQDAKVAVDDKLGKMVGALGEGITRVEYGRAGASLAGGGDRAQGAGPPGGLRAGVDIYIEPSEPAAKHPSPPPAEAN